MGATLLQIIENSSCKYNLKFLKDNLSDEKFNMLHFLNSNNNDYILDKFTFCSCFLTEEINFKILDSKNIGLTTFWHLFTLMYLIKNDSFQSKLLNILNIFSVEEINVITKAEFIFLSEVFVSIIKKLFFESLFEESENIEKEITNQKDKFIDDIFIKDQILQDSYKIIDMIQ